MSMSWNSFVVAVVMKDGKIIEHQFGFADEAYVEFSDQSGLFEKIDTLKDFQNQLLAAFYTGNEEYSLKEMLCDLGSPDTISVVTRDMKGYEPEDIAVVVLMTNEQVDTGREYVWKKYELHPYRMTQGDALAKYGEDLYSDAIPSVHDFIHDTVLMQEDMPNAESGRTDKGLQKTTEDAPKDGESWEKDGFKVENGVLVACGEAQKVMCFPPVKTIDIRFLRGDENLEELEFSEGTEEIAGGFYGCVNLRRVVFPKSLRRIGAGAFSSCEALTELAFPKTLEEIEESAFEGCSNLQSVDIPDSAECRNSAFRGCRALADEDGFVIVNRTLFDFVKDAYDKSRRDADEQMIITIPPTVSRIDGTGMFDTMDCFGECIGTFTVTDAISYINPEDFYVFGINLFRIVDHVTGKTIFETDAFAEVQTVVTESDRFEEFCELVCEKNYDALREKFALSDNYQPPISALRSATPERSLYPNYAAKSSSPFSGFSGVTVVHNPTGTDYQLIKLGADKEEKDWPQYVRRVYKLVSHDYSLADTARGMIGLFHVDEEAFSMGHDRECELREGYMHKAYMMSALRSFAWTLAAYCEAEGKSPETVDLAMLCRITEFIKERQWLNYDGNSYCKGLCGGSDLHTFYLPDAVTPADRKRFLPTKEEVAKDNEIKKKFPNYNPIYGEVHSLEALREDLTYLYPAIKTLYEHLAEDRDTGCELVGAEADVVYVWIALAIAAENPFFTEDGPMRCFFTWPGESDNAASHMAEKKEIMPEKAVSPRKAPGKPVCADEKVKEKTEKTDDAPSESPEEKRAEAAEAANALREALAQEAQQLREQMEALYEQKQQAIKAAEEARKREAEEAERRRREAEALAEQKRREEAAAAERRRQAAAREAEERKRREAEELAARKRREAAAREQELEREKSQLHARREALQKERDAIKGLFAKARKAKLEPQIAEIETKLAQMEEELKTIRAMM